jgi:hypothetical protein
LLRPVYIKLEQATTRKLGLQWSQLYSWHSHHGKKKSLNTTVNYNSTFQQMVVKGHIACQGGKVELQALPVYSLLYQRTPNPRSFNAHISSPNYGTESLPIHTPPAIVFSNLRCAYCREAQSPVN